MASQLLRTCWMRPHFRVLNLKCLQAAVISKNFHQFKNYFQIPLQPQTTSLLKIHLSTKMSSQVVKLIDFKEVQALGSNGGALIIDVREPNELQETGVLPGSINIPLGSVENALKNLDNDGFQTLYGQPKPTQDFPLVFSCKSGNRSTKASEIAIQLGYENVSNYKGGWIDWEQNTKV